jgi:hypothetical protein
MNGRERYILHGRAVVEEPDLVKWAKWMQHARMRVGLKTIDDAQVSTVFLGVDHNHTSGSPQIFETMIFGGKYDQWVQRYATWDEAEDGHVRVVRALKAGKRPDFPGPVEA